jgi:tape measure domain-containing protein
MAIELASGYVSLSVKLDGVNRGLNRMFGAAQSQAASAGRSAGSAYTSALEKEVKDAEAQVKKVSESIVKLRDKEADAAGKLAVATEKLNEAHAAGVTGSRLMQLEQQREAALRRQQAASRDLARDTDGLTAAQARLARAQNDVDQQARRQQSTFGKIKGFFSRAGRDAGEGFSNAASRAMRDGGIGGAAASAGAKAKSSFLGSVGKAAALAAPFVGVGAVISKGWGRMVAIDNAQAKMRQLGIEGERLDAVMDTVKTSVTGTAFGLGDAASVASNALSAGVKEGADLAQHMQTIVDTAAYGQVPLEEMGTIMNRAKISGKVLSEDLNMLGDRGTPIYDWLQEDLGMAGDALAKFVSDGNLQYDQLNETLQKHAKGAGQRSGETFTGALSNLSAAAGRMGEKLLTPIFKPLQQGVVGLTDLFNKAGPGIESFVTGISEKVGGIFTGTLIPAFQSALPTIQTLWTNVTTAFQNSLPTLQRLWDSISNAATTVFPIIVQQAKELWENFGPSITNLFDRIVGAVQDAWPTIKNLLIGAGAAIAGAFLVVKEHGPMVVDIVAGIVDWIGKLSPVLYAIVPAMLMWKYWSVLTTTWRIAVISFKVALFAVKAAIWLVTGAFKVLTAAFRMSPFGFVVTAIMLLIAGFVLLYNKCDWFKNAVDAVWNWIKNAAAKVAEWFTNTLVPWLSGVWDKIKEGAAWLWDKIQAVWNGIKTAIGIAVGIIEGYVNLVISFWKGVGAAAMWLWEKITDAWNWIKDAISKVWEWLNTNVLVPLVQKFWEIREKAIALKDKVVETWDKIKTSISDMWDSAKEKFKSFIDGVKNIKDKVLEYLKPVTDMFGKVKDGLSNIPVIGGLFGGDKPQGQATGGIVPGLKRGGAVRDRRGKLSGPGTGTSDSILGVDAYGMPVVRVSAGEGVVKHSAMKQGGAGLVAALNAGWVPSAEYLRDMVYGVPGAAGGLNPGAAWLKNFIQQKWGAISDIGGYRAEDGYGEHSSGNALDIMIPSWQSADGVSLGNTVASFLAANKDTLPVYGMIWQQKSYGYGGGWGGKPMEDRGSPTQNHMDHIHVWLGNGQKGAGAASTATPTSGLKLPGGGISSPGGFGSGGSGSGGYSVGGKTISAASRDKQLGSKRDALEKAERDNDLAKRELETAKAEGKTKAETLERKQNAIDDRDKRIEKLKSEIAELEGAEFVQGTGKGSGSGSGGGSDNPFSKIIDGFSQLGTMAKDGLMETFLPPGFDNPMEWGIPKAAGGLLNFGAGLANASGNPMLGGILGMFGAGVTGDVGGVGQALTGMLSPQGTQQTLGVGADQLSADTVDGGGFDPVTGTNTGGVTYDQSITVNNPTATDTVNTSIQASANKQLANFRGSLGTKAV